MTATYSVGSLTNYTTQWSEYSGGLVALRIHALQVINILVK